jgi:Flp pilus assembly protein TadD
MNSWDWNGAEREHRLAIAIDPGYPDAHERLSVLLTYLGRDQEAMAEQNLALQLNPLGGQLNANLGLLHYYAGRHDEAIEALERTVERDPTNPSAYMLLAWVYPERDRFEEAVAAAWRYMELGGQRPDALSALGFALARAGRRSQADSILRVLETRAKQEYVPPSEFAIVNVGLGRSDQVIAWLERGFRESDPKLRRLKVDHRFDPVRADPRFQDLLRRLGLSG